MKLLAISDIHSQFNRFSPASLPEADVALICGDFTNEGVNLSQEVGAARQWMRQMAGRYPQVFYVLGNHDLGMADSCFEQEGLALHNIARTIRVVNGRRFVGADFSPCFDLPQLADEWDHMTADVEADAAYYDSLPDADIVVSHCPPFGLLDEFRYRGSGEHLGSPGLRGYLERVRPLLVVFGHIHEGSGETLLVNTHVVNVARRYQLLEID